MFANSRLGAVLALALVGGACTALDGFGYQFGDAGLGSAGDAAR